MSSSSDRHRIFRVWGFHHRLFHYRIPVWDRLVERGRGRYELTMFGETDNGKAVGGESRDYLRHMFVTNRPFSVAYTFQGAYRLVKRERPDILLVLTNPRNRFCWQAPALARSYGAVSIAWSKVHSYSRTPRWLLQSLKRPLYSCYDFAFTYGPASTRELTSLGFPAEQTFSAYNTIDTSYIFTQGEHIRRRGEELRRAHGLADKNILLCVSKMAPRKRHQDLLTAWPRLRELDPRLVLVLIGRGPLTENIRAEAHRIDPKRIIFLGVVPERDDYHWMATADITIQCGQVGLALNQSMALGTPTVIADEPGADSEILQDGRTGWRYEKGNVEALVGTVRRVLEDTDERQTIVRRAQTFMRDEVTIDHMVDGLDSCITAAIKLWRTRNGSARPDP